MGYVVVGALTGPLRNMNNPPATVRDKIRQKKDASQRRRDVYFLTLNQLRRERWPVPFAKVTIGITLGVPDGRSRDPHNYEANCKELADGLVDAGVVPDDNPTYVQMLPVKLDRQLKGKFKIEITTVEEPA